MPLGFFGNSSGGYSSSIPFQRIVEPAQLGFFLNLEQAELLRIQRYGEHQRFYLGKHWSYTRDDGEPLSTVNYFKKLVDKGVEFLFGAGFSTTVPEALEEVTLPLLEEVWEYNGPEQIAWDMGVMGGVTGDVFVMVTYEEPSAIQRRINPFSQGKIRIVLLGSEQVFPTWDPLNIEALTAVRIETIFYAERGVHQLDNDSRQNHQGKTLYTKRFTQIITADQIVEQFHGDQPIVRPNILGEIPLVHIPNLRMPREYYGLPDGLDIIDVQRQYNEVTTDWADAINYAGHPITVVFGAKAKNLEVGPRQLWAGLPADARVEQLPPQSDLPGTQAFLDRKKKEMCELMDVPEGSLGEMQPISNTSGVALDMMYQPLKARTERKWVNYRAGLRQINYFILRIAHVMGLVGLPFDLCAECGGRIVEAETGEWAYVWQHATDDPAGGSYAWEPVRRKRCYVVNKQTLDFEDPDKMRLKFVREYGFGREVREAPYWAIEREISAGQPSFWDYARQDLLARRDYQAAVVQHASSEQQRARSVVTQPSGTYASGDPIPQQFQAVPPPPPPTPQVMELPAQFIDVPEEPEDVVVVVQYRHPATGDLLEEQRVQAFLVPTGCLKPKYLNPYENDVERHDILPKDQTLLAQLYGAYMQMGLADAFWVRRKIPELAKDSVAIERRMRSQNQANPMSPGGGFQDANGQGTSGYNAEGYSLPAQGAPATELAPADQHPPGGSENYGGRPVGS